MTMLHKRLKAPPRLGNKAARKHVQVAVNALESAFVALSWDKLEGAIDSVAIAEDQIRKVRALIEKRKR